MIIYDAGGVILLDIEVDDTSIRYKAIKGENSLTLKFSLAQHIEFPLGCWCDFKGDVYSLMASSDITLHHRRNFEYTLVMYSEDAKAERYKFRNPVDGSLKFPLTAYPEEHLQMFVDNMNAREPEGKKTWKVKECIEHERITLSYNHTNCKDALVQLADHLEVDYWFDGRDVYLGKLEKNKENPLTLSYGGDGQGLKSGIKRTNYSDALPIEILYIEGSEKNIDFSKYGSKELHLPKSHTIGYDGINFSDEDGFDSQSARWYVTDENGYSVRRNDKVQTTFAEDSLDCTEITPTKEEKVDVVVEVNAENHFYDLLFKSDVDYKKYQIAGETAYIVFQKGMLAGKEFDLATTGDGNIICEKIEDYWRVEIKPQEIDGILMPDKDTHFVPVANDTFKVFGVQLPDEYISDAELNALKYAVKHLYANEVPQYTIAGELDEIYAKRNWSWMKDKIVLGGYVSFSDISFQEDPILIRITGIKEYVNKPYSPQLELSNQNIGSTLVGTLNRIENHEVYNEVLYRNAVNYSKRRFRDAQETISMLEKAMLDGFTETVSPIAVRTMSALVGDESLQFRFVNSKTNPTKVDDSLAYSDLTKKVTWNASIVQHMTLGINEVSSKYEGIKYKFWSISKGESQQTDANKSYYLYIRANANTEKATFVLSEDAIGLRDESGYYHFLTAILNKEIEGTRSFVTLYGFTEVLPGQISTDVIRSADGNMIIDLVKAVITAKKGAKIVGEVEFSAGSSGLENLAEWSEKQNQIDKAQTDANTAKTNASNAQTIANTANASVQTLNTRIDGVDKTIAEINNKLDGVVESFFEPRTPSKTNEPAKTWINKGTQEEHIGDTFTNTSTSGEDAGKSWRWLKQSDGTYDWQLIADSDAAKALALAGQAMDSANRKTTTFLVTPSNYKKNDIWIVGDDVPSGFAFKKGDILVTDHDSASYVANHWSKVINYNDEFQKELEASVSALEKAIEDAETASKGYTEEAKTALQESIDALNRAKADLKDVYDKTTVDGKVSASEQKVIIASQQYVDAQNKVLDAQIKGWANGEINQAEQDAIDAANAELEKAKKELDAAIAEVEGLANTAIANANNAASKADAATREASSAKEIADAAKSVSESASALAQEANANASTAIDNASAAVTKANTAQGIASAAQNLANEAKELSQQANTNAEQAKTNADKAMEDAKTANDTLGAWAGDGISPIEKKGYEEEWVSVYLDFINIRDDAYKYGLSDDANYTEFVTAYNAYYKDLDEILRSQEEVVPAPEDFSNHLSQYYASRFNILQTISTKAKEVADDAQQAADDAQKTADDASDLATEAKEFAVIAQQAADDANKLISAVDGDTVLTGLEKQSLRESISRITSITDSTKLLGQVKRQIGKYEISNVLGTIGSKVVKSGDTNNGYSQNAYVGWNALNGIGDTKTNATRMVFSLDKPADVTIQYQSNAESRYDFLVLGALDVVLDLTKASSYTSENTDITKPSSTAGNQDKVFSKTFPLTAGTHFIDVCYRKDGSQSTNTDAGYFRVISDEYGKVDGYVTRAVGKGSFPTFYNKLADDGNEEQAGILHRCLVDLLDILENNDVWDEGNTTVFAEFRSELMDFVAKYCGYEAETVKNLASDWEYLKTAFSKGTTNVSGGVVMTNMVAVKDADEEEVEAFLNGSDFGHDEEHKKLILAAGIPEGADALDERAKSAATRIYEDGTIDTNKLLAKGGMIGGLYLEDGRLFCKDSDGNIVIEISPESAILNSKPQYYGRLFSQAILSGASDALDANSAFRLSLAGQPSEEAPEEKTLFFIDGGSQFGNRDNAIAIGRGMVAGFRPKCVVLNDGETYYCTSYDHTLISNSAGTYTNVIVLPSNPQDGQEIKIWKNNDHILKVRTTDGRKITRMNILPATEHGITNQFMGTLDLVYHSSIGGWLMIIHETY